MPSFSQSAQVALLKAVRLFFPEAPASNDASPHQHLELTAYCAKANRVFDLGRTAESLDGLTSGVVLANILHELDPEFDPSHLETSTTTSKYLTNKRNLQTVYKGLFRFIRRQIPELICQAKKYDYHAIADSPDPQGMSQVRPRLWRASNEVKLQSTLIDSCFQLLAVMVSAAALGPDNQKYIPRIQNSLDHETQAEIMQVLRIVQQDIAASKGDDDLEEAMDAVMEARDVDLLVEEQNAALRQQLEVTKRNLSDYITRLEHLQLSHEELRYEKEKNDRELEVLRKATQDGASNAEAIKMLENQVHEQMEIIARYEEIIRNHDKVKSQLEAEVQRLTLKSIQADELRDQATEWKHKAEELEKKSNIAERYKQKLESQQHLVKEVQNLQYERAELQEQLRSLMDDKERYARTRKAEDELTKMITQSEQHLWDERNQKSQLIRDVAALQDELLRLENQRSHDESFIQDLQEQLQQGVGTAPQGGEPVPGSGLNLEDELNNASEDGQTNMPLEFSRLKAENDLLRRTMGSTGDAALLRRELEEEKSHRERLQDNFNDMFEKNAVAQSQIEALMDNMTGEGLVNALDQIMNLGPVHPLSADYFRTQAFANLRTENIQKTDELEKARKRIVELENQNSDQARELLALNTELSAVEKDSVEALDQLKRTDGLIAESLQAELGRLRDKHNILIRERDAQKSQLIEALLAKDKLRKYAEDGKDLQDAISKDPDVSEAVKKEGEKIEKLRARLLERNDVSEPLSVPEDEEMPPELWPRVPSPLLAPSLTPLVPIPLSHPSNYFPPSPILPNQESIGGFESIELGPIPPPAAYSRFVNQAMPSSTRRPKATLGFRRSAESDQLARPKSTVGKAWKRLTKTFR